MNVQPLGVTKEQAGVFLKEYKAHRDVYDKRDWEIERIYRAISKGKVVISAPDAIHRAGLDTEGRPKLAICKAHAMRCICDGNGDYFTFGIDDGTGWNKGAGRVRIPWPNCGYKRAVAALPRIPPQHRPAQSALSNYHILWEADWHDLPRDPYLLRRIGKDAWIVLAAWELTDVEISVLRARPTQ